MLWLLLACASSKPETTSVSSEPGAAPPDIVLVVVDTLRADHLSLYGYARKTTPNLDRLAAQGLWFRRAYSQSGWTLPSFSSILTGLLPHQHRVGRDPEDPSRFGRLPDEVQTLAERLAGAGYNTGAVINNTFLAPEFGLKQGFQSYDWQGADTGDARSATDTVARGLAWLDQQRGPTFLLLHFMEPHLSYDPGPFAGAFVSAENPPVTVPFRVRGDTMTRWQTRKETPPIEVQAYVQGLYDEEILRVDQSLGELVDGLVARGRLDHTLLAFTADHGEEFWDHGGFEHGHSVFGELTHIPLVLLGAVPFRGEVDAVVQHIDLARTLVDASRGAQTEGLAGIDLFGIAAGSADVAGRLAISENCLYGPPCLSAVSANHRVVVNQATHRALVLTVNAQGGDGPPEPDSEQIETSMLRVVAVVRGSLEPAIIQPGPAILSSDQFQQLKALGYLEESSSGP
jgi:arylsulfatase A-like enzyme